MIKLPLNFWQIIEKNLPNYSSRNDVLENDILQRFVNEEPVSNEDAEWIAGIANNKNDIKKALHLSNVKLYIEALENIVKSCS